jgi:hypothetical protein|nr:MAG TPA: lyase [Bacteriophage sp.]
MKKISPFELRSTLYMPATKENLIEIISKQDKTNADGIVFCFEDALNVLDIPKGIENLNAVFESLTYEPVTGEVAGEGKLPYRFIRVRSIENYHLLMQALTRKVLRHIDGFVIPKFTLGNINEWEKALKDTDYWIMPTLETEDYYNPMMIVELFNRLAISPLKERVLVLRLGGNDLLRGLAMKRPKRDEVKLSLKDVEYSAESRVTLNRTLSPYCATIYDTPILSVINQVMIQARYRGFEVTAPVFEYFDDNELPNFLTELAKDRIQGFIGKTAIHPKQCKLINQVFSISESSLELAQAIMNEVELNGLNGGVSNNNQSMIEPTTHHAWAKRLTNK